MKRKGRAAKGHTSKHVGSHKHHAHGAKHHPAHHPAAHQGAHHQPVHTKGKHPHHPRGLALADGVACCSAEALAASLRLAGAAVSDDDVLALHWRAGGDVDTGVPILAALEAASVWGLAGCRPVSFGPVGAVAGRDSNPDAMPLSATDGAPRQRSSLLLGLELPGPHAVLAEPGRWWSWGERYDPASFPHAVIEEAWVISWLS